MAVQLNPYLSFRDGAREALEHYRSVLGGTLEISTFGELGMGEPAERDKVMHGALRTEDGLVLMAADTPDGMEVAAPAGFSLSLSGDDEARLRGCWDALTADGAVTMPLERAPWGDLFGMCVDRFGVAWMVDIG